MSARRTPAVLQSFNWAFEGVIHVLRTERNMRIHFALATAVLIDATVVRLVLVPAALELFGDRNWWFPGRFRRPAPAARQAVRREA